MAAERKTKSRKKKNPESDQRSFYESANVEQAKVIKELEKERDQLHKELDLQIERNFQERTFLTDENKRLTAELKESRQTTPESPNSPPLDGIPKIIEKLDRVVQELKGHTALDQSADILLLEEIKVDLSRL